MWNFSQISPTFSVRSLDRCGEWQLKATVFQTAKPCAEYLTSSIPSAFLACPSAPNSVRIYLLGLSLN